jgi:hypothetical protein
VSKLDDSSKAKNMLKIFIGGNVSDLNKNPLSKELSKVCQAKFKMLVLLDLVH